jgi:hypothetical protein
VADTMSDVTRRLRFTAIHRPFTLVFAVVMPFPGALGIIYGDAVSRALANLAAGVISRGIGLALFVGGVTAFWGIAKGKALAESTGLSVMALGCGVYGLGVLLGLGLAGAVAGPGFLAIAAGTVLRVISLTGAAHEVAQRNGGPPREYPEYDAPPRP